MGIIFFKKLDSTNTYSKENHSSLKHKDVIIAETQTKGRGRYQRTWVSNKGGLYFSIVLKPKVFSRKNIPNLTQSISVAICKAIEKYSIKPQIKWPNDILVNNKKACGILSETVFENNKLKAIILGVGINIEQKNLNKIEKPAISLKTLGLNIDKEKFLAQILKEFFRLYPKTLSKGFEAIQKDYNKYFAYIGKEIKLQHIDKIYEAKVKGVDKHGAIILEDELGNINHLHIGDIL
ncbi:MAG: biotin--[acetyl-CoA-carboxylase] ligase [Elusimicrobiaceae bacterium]|nr:biotin--[acetyl-CoA-carboxylase] ligase [Elusimicrobiaceae bacterium]MBT5987563.1 biotin--[acetyl-CoA-carboxylase] ligase [Elusimicrobiaceae bacterium]